MNAEHVIEKAVSGRLVRGVVHNGNYNRFIVEKDDVIVHNSDSSYDAKIFFDQQLEQMKLEIKEFNERADEEVCMHMHEQGLI